MMRLKTILHPTDFGEHSRYALEVACALARDQAARVIVLHVLPRPAPMLSVGHAPAVKEEHAREDLATYREEMTARLEAMREEAPWTGVDTMLCEGDVVATIIHTAEEHPCDLIVMGTHGKSRMHQLTMGSAAAEVTRKAPCPVLAVRMPATVSAATEKS
jgi:nucleotide-binding universal stress UspA family protein